MIKKLLYSAPEAELLVVRFEENFCETIKSDSPSNDFGDNNLGDLDDDE